MKTQEEKLKHVMEASGECWHDFSIPEDYRCLFVCTKCAVEIKQTPIPLPSPDDLNELFRLAEKLGYTTKRFKIEIMTRIECFIGKSITEANYGYGYSDTEAILNALFIATGGKDE